MYARTDNGVNRLDHGGPAHDGTQGAGEDTVRREAAGVDEHHARHSFGAFDGQPACGVPADGVADDDEVVQLELVDEFDCQVGVGVCQLVEQNDYHVGCTFRWGHYVARRRVHLPPVLLGHWLIAQRRDR